VVHDRLFRQRYRFGHRGEALVIDIWSDPGGGVLAEHFHPMLEERYEVLQGEVTAVVDGRAQVLGPGERAVVPAGAKHRFPHLNGHDVTLVAESIAPLGELHPYKKRMGWRFPWVSSLGSDFKYDFGAAFTEEQQRNGAEYNFRRVDQPPQQKEGMSAFALEDGVVHHTYSTYERGVEQLMGTYGFLDVAPAAWWHRHDEYETARDEAAR
jgi:mannose-6-phosphate isomerase-like protein (cupin superfamily)